MFTTRHRIFFQDSKSLKAIQDGSVDLVVTSPPYPMISMWDDYFCENNKDIRDMLQNNDAHRVHSLMHTVLQSVWQEVARVVKTGGIVCINIGDATRTLHAVFRLYSNKAPIIQAFTGMGFGLLPIIIWRKEANTPNKFMGSGMLPVGAYVTLEHEYILIFRKQGKRDFRTADEKQNRRRSAFFYEERNKWFSDIWYDVKGTRQYLESSATRNRSAAYPLEIPYRLINMFSVIGDTVLDPFLGTGTTMEAAIALGRNSVGVEIENTFQSIIERKIMHPLYNTEKLIEKRIGNHLSFIDQRINEGKSVHYRHLTYDFPVVTSQEQDILFTIPSQIIKKSHNEFMSHHKPFVYEELRYKKTEIPSLFFS